MKSTVVAIDGPAGAGKSTIARALAEKLGFAYINTGSLYRALAFAARQEGEDLNALSPAFLNKHRLEYRKGVLYLDGTDPGEQLRTAQCAADASFIAKQPAVREYLLPVQRNSAADCWIVMEGRDIGTVVFPDAQCKIFLTASVEERARRRLAQAGEVQKGATLKQVMAEIAARDEQDSTRKTAPLKAAPDAVAVDTTGLSIEQVIEKIAGIVQASQEK